MIRVKFPNHELGSIRSIMWGLHIITAMIFISLFNELKLYCHETPLRTVSAMPITLLNSNHLLPPVLFVCSMLNQNHPLNHINLLN